MEIINYKTLTEARLADLLNLKDKRAFEEVYSRYWALLYIHAKKMLGDEDQAKDIVQELFTKLLAHMGKVHYESTISSFLYKSTRNMILNLIKHQKVRINYIASIQAFHKDGDFTTDKHIRESELKREIEKEISRLPSKMRAILELSRKTPLSNQEIAVAVNTSEDTVRKQLYNAAKILRSKLSYFICLQIIAAIQLIYRSF